MKRYLLCVTATLSLIIALSSCSPPAPAVPAVTVGEVIPGVASNADYFSVVVLPDTQYYSETYPHIFLAQTQWIADNVDKLNIVFVTHSGDIVNDYNNEEQWDFADIAMRKLDSVVPYGVLPGNHDQPTTFYNTYFGADRFTGMTWYGGHYGETNDNNYELIAVEKQEFLFIQLQYAPTPEEIRWADNLMRVYSDRTVVLNTHSALDTNSILTPEGETLLPLIQDNDNLRLVLCGHVHGEALKTLSYGKYDTDILLADYQKLEKGGNCYLRILTFIPARHSIVVNTFSPFLNEYQTDDNSHFALDFK